jgi:hypothetical protein
MRAWGYTGPAHPTLANIILWQTRAAANPMLHNGAWQFFCEGILSPGDPGACSPHSASLGQVLSGFGDLFGNMLSAAAIVGGGGPEDPAGDALAAGIEKVTSELGSVKLTV